MKASNPQPLLLTTAEAAKELGLSPRTLEGMRVRGSGPPYIKLGPGTRSRVAYRAEDIQLWLERYVYRSTSQYCSATAHYFGA